MDSSGPSQPGIPSTSTPTTGNNASSGSKPVMSSKPGNPSGASHEPRHNATVNVPDRFELFLLGDGEKKITEAADNREYYISVCGR
jgi:hypothetical protein